jgi:hypothetical protein
VSSLLEAIDTKKGARREVMSDLLVKTITAGDIALDDSTIQRFKEGLRGEMIKQDEIRLDKSVPNKPEY